MSGFTKGPWDKYDLIIGKMVDGRNRYTSIASIYESESGYDGEDQLNAHLIAAAPDLYEALEECQQALKLHMDAYPHMAKGYTVDAEEKARTALAKARGGT